MANHTNIVSNVVETNIHCPYCGSNEALLISEPGVSKKSIQLPSVGLKFVLRFLFFGIIHLLTEGFKLIELQKETKNVTYGFCPLCGNSYSMRAPQSIKAASVEEPKLYRIREGKVATGLCKGIAEYTGMAVLRVRIIMVLYSLMIFPAIFYFLFSLCIPFDDEENQFAGKKLCRIRKGKDMMGLCTGISAYTDIPVSFVRLMMLLTGPFYFLIAAFFPVKEDLEEGKQKRKLHKSSTDKVFLGLCGGFAAHTKMPVLVVRILMAVFSLLVLPAILYFVIGAIVPSEESENEE